MQRDCHIKAHRCGSLSNVPLSSLLFLDSLSNHSISGFALPQQPSSYWVTLCPFLSLLKSLFTSPSQSWSCLLFGFAQYNRAASACQPWADHCPQDDKISHQHTHKLWKERHSVSSEYATELKCLNRLFGSVLCSSLILAEVVLICSRAAAAFMPCGYMNVYMCTHMHSNVR